MENIMKQFIQILRNNPDKAFDFISNNSYLFSKNELVDIIKELLYSIYNDAKWYLITTTDYNRILENAADTLEDIYTE